MATIAEILDGHVTLEVECVDRLYLNGYIPSLATPGGLTFFMREHLGKPIPSLAVLGQITSKFRESVKAFAAENEVPLIQFESGERKDDRANQLRRERGVRGGVVFIGVAQEKAKAFSGKLMPEKGPGWFEYTRDKAVYVNHYYFYVDDEEFGPAFVKVCSYAPWALKVCLNGHEWAKRQLDKLGIGYTALDNGFLECADPQALQKVCDSLGPQQIEAFLARWLERLPMPLTSQDRAAGYTWQLSIWQMETSLTQVFDRPARGREFFEEVLRDNLDLGRPDRVQLVFDRKIVPSTPGTFRTRVIQNGVLPSLHIEYKSFDLKQYFKEGRALRTEGTFRNPKDFNVNKGLSNFGYLQQIGRQINRRLLEVERVSQNCGLSADGIQRVVQPTVSERGASHRAPGWRQDRSFEGRAAAAGAAQATARFDDLYSPLTLTPRVIFNTMGTAIQTTIDSAGRLVLPKTVREEAGILPGMALRITVQEGRIEIEPVPSEVLIIQRGPLRIAVPVQEGSSLTEETVQRVRREIRKHGD
jgi:AbrB family looped-hinge helix DNA binding protein